MMQLNLKNWLKIAALNGFLAVVMGAVGAHAIADTQLVALAEKASYYQLIHAVVLLWLSGQQGKFFAYARWFFLLGITLFCGSLFLKALTGIAAATTFAPFGGICLMLGWLLMAFAA